MLKSLMTLAAAASVSAVSMAGTAHAGPDQFIGDITLTSVIGFCPRGTLSAEGQILSISEYNALFSLYGTMYGGDGRTSFGLPDLRGRTAVHTTFAPPYIQGGLFGAETKTLTVAELPPHTHRVNTGAEADRASTTPGGHYISSFPSAVKSFAAPGAPTGDFMNAGMIQSAGSASPSDFNLVAPSIALRWCITVTGTYPPRS